MPKSPKFKTLVETFGFWTLNLFRDLCFEFRISFCVATQKVAGQIMLIGLLLLAGVMGIGLALGFLFIKEAQLARETPLSVQAIYAADSGIELQLYNYFKEPNLYNGQCQNWPLSNGAVLVERRLRAPVSSLWDCEIPGTATSVEAIGESAGGKVRRGLRVISLP